MKIKKPNAGALTNFEVLDFLQARGASKDSSRVIAPIASSEYKVYDYLVETPACRQTREQIHEFMEKCKPYKLAKAEILNIINIAPRELVEIDPIIEHSEMRLGDQVEELLDLVREVFPPPDEPTAEAEKDRGETENEQNEDMNDTSAGEHIDGDRKESVDGEPMETS